MGRTAPEFAKAAQKNANAFWMFAIVGAVVWWLASWKWALIPGAFALWAASKSVSATLIQRLLEARTSEPGRESVEEMFRLVSDYGDALSAHSAAGGVVADESLLPAPKAKLRQVFLTLIATVKDATQREQLKSAYLMLAHFQPGVGSQVIKIDDLDAGMSLESQAARIAEQAGQVTKWTQASVAEMDRLQEDLKKIGQRSE